MTTLLTHFIIAVVISFVGSLPFGMVNMAVAHTAIRKGMTPAMFMAVGVCLVELVQAFVALKFTWLFNEHVEIERTFQIIATIAFAIGGIYFLFFAKSEPAAELADAPKIRRRNDFFKGAFLSSVNLLAIPFWISFAAILTANDLLERDNLHVFVFAVGTAVGTFGLLVCYSLLGAKVFSKSEQIKRWVNKFIGVLLIGFGVWQIIKMLNG
jgi:threonine/homoserine/homoserine lactone efflux protein